MTQDSDNDDAPEAEAKETPETRPEPERSRNPLRLLLGGGAAIIGGFAAVIGGITGFFGDFNKIVNLVQEPIERWDYMSKLRNPYPVALTDEEVANWTSGRTRLAEIQIKGFLGQINFDQPANAWMKTCLKSSLAFPGHAQVNTKYKNDPNDIDRNNLRVLRDHLESLEATKQEERQFFEIADLQERLFARAKIQLLSQFEKSEIETLGDRRILYFLRNRILADRGYAFSTNKLAKYFSRMGYQPDANFSQKQLSPLEHCNMIYLENLYEVKTPGAFGRAVSISVDEGALRRVKTRTCHCLRGKGIDCEERKGRSREALFASDVDLLIDVTRGPQKAVGATMLDPAFAKAGSDWYRKKHELAEGDLDDAVQQSIRYLASNAPNDDVKDEGVAKDRYMALNLSLDAATIKTLSANPIAIGELANTLCKSAFEFLEQDGDYIPHVAKPNKI